jgi:predicted RNA binding protein YcfA (HicA-like mRNA interferase family)
MMRSADLIREIERAGWRLDRVRGSHHVFRHATHAGRLVVPHPKKDLGKGLVAQIRKEARIH